LCYGILVIDAVYLIVHPTNELLGILLLTFEVSLIALLLAALFGLPFGTMVVLRKVPLKGLVVELVNLLAGLPPVVVGLFLFLLISKSGPLGFAGVIYTPAAMVIALFILAFPIVASQTRLSLLRVDPSVYVGARTLGASPRQLRKIVIGEARHGIVMAVLSAFGRIMSDVGAILIVGGNIVGTTRVMTTAIALETDNGDIKLVLALGILLFLVSVLINLGLYMMRRKVRYEA
jgi:tungstate transport system permease protein